MSEFLIIITILLLCLCPIALIVFWLINNKKRKSFNMSFTRTEEASNNITRLDTIIETCVGSVNKKMVSNLKNEGNFLQSDKEEAINECKKMIFSMVNPETLEYINNLDIDTDAWINTRIEYFVRKQKDLQRTYSTLKEFPHHM